MDIALSKCASSKRTWAAKNPKLTLHAVTDTAGSPLHNLDKAGRRLCVHWKIIFQDREDAILHDQTQATLSDVQPAPHDTNCDVSWN